jgi:ectoine hydroxylase
MNLSPSQIKSYQENGFLVVENVFSREEADRMLEEMFRVIGEDCPRRILEKNGSVRSFFAPEQSSELFNSITRINKLVNPAMQLIGEKVYIHQTKLNTKHALVGDWWEWHQDYTFWKQDDGMPECKVLTAMIFLNDVNEFNGPMLLIPGSHEAGTVDEDENEAPDSNDWYQKYQQSASYLTALTSDLKYTLKQQTLARWARKKGLAAAKGPAGSVLFFHGNIFHASSNNLSPWDRHTFLVTYNSLNNKLPDMPNPRPQFIANRDFRPLAVLEAF